MKVKNKIFVFALILSLMFCLTAVVANENISFDQSELKANDNTEVEIHPSEDILGDKTELATFSDVQKLIDDADEGSTIFLDAKTYSGSSSINVTKPVTIVGGSDFNDGSYATLNGENKIRIMEITASNVVIKNIRFVNGYAPSIQKYDPNAEGDVWVPTDGGAISAAGANLSIISCDFSNNAATWDGGAIKINETAINAKIDNCNFINNWGRNGGAVKVIADDVKILDSNFTNNFAASFAAIEAAGRNMMIANGNFIDNNVEYDGGAIGFSGFNTTISNSRFVKNRANRDGAIIIAAGSNSTIKGNIFAESYSNRQCGGIYISTNNVVVGQNEFYNNVAAENGDNIFIRGTKNYIVNNSFYDPSHISMGIYENSPGSSVITNNSYTDYAYGIIMDTTFTGFAGKTLQIPVEVYDFSGLELGAVTLYGYGDHTPIDGMAIFTISLPTSPSLLNSRVKYKDKTVDILIEVLSHDSILEITQDTQDDIIVSLGEGAGGSVIVNINGISYFADAVNSTATLKASGLVNGEYTAVVLYSGDDNYSSEWRIVKINITQSPVYKITENADISVKYSGKATYKVLITRDGKPAGAGESVVIAFNGKSTVVKTDAQGYATLELDSNVKPGTYDIRTTWGGVSVTNKVKVSQIIKASDKKVKKSAKHTKIKIGLDKVDGKYLSGKSVKVKFNGKTYRVKTNKKGVAIWKVKKSMLKKLKVGKKVKYTVTYGKDVLTKKLTIKK